MPPDNTTPIAHLSDSTLAELHAATEDAVAQGIKKGIRAAIEDDEIVELFWDKGVQVAKRQAKVQAGTLLVDGFAGVFRSLWKVVAGGMIVYYLGGWDLLAYYLKLLFPWGSK